MSELSTSNNQGVDKPEVVPRVIGSKKKKKTEKAFIFDNYPSRKIAIRVAYHGHVHDGLAKQEETSNTVEEIVVTALKRVRLIPESGPVGFSRCGRTDKGVSALGNALSFMARASCAATDDPQKPPFDYCHMLNNVLPPTVRVVGFALVDDSFDARFSCVSRSYRYYFCHRGLNLGAMKTAAQFMLGTHNFRNLCKMDVVNVSNFTREVTAIGIYESELLPELISYLEIKANSFLYHQIRCVMEVLFLVGRGLEKPEVVRTLLKRGDCKPQYPLADGTPLILWDCGFENIEWHISHRAFQSAERELQDICTALLIRATAGDAMRRQLFRWYDGHEDVCAAATGGSPALLAAPNSGNESDRKPLIVWKGADAGSGCSGSNSDPSAVRVVDNWAVTGCDWTEPRTHDNLKVRKYDLFNALRYEDECILAHKQQQQQQQNKSGGADGDAGPVVYTPKGYVPLLERETERTYEEQVAELAGKKRARYEINEEKKATGASRNAAQRTAADAPK